MKASTSILAASLALAAVAAHANGEEPTVRLPQPHYEPVTEDPAWLRFAAQFHGHLGPWAAAGTRLGAAAREAADAPGYFNLEVTCLGPFEAPPRSCLLDGVQVATGATWGKRNLHWQPADRIAVRLRNTRSGKTVVVRPTERLLALLGSFEPRAKSASGVPATKADNRNENTQGHTEDHQHSEVNGHDHTHAHDHGHDHTHAHDHGHDHTHAHDHGHDERHRHTSDDGTTADDQTALLESIARRIALLPDDEILSVEEVRP